MGDSASQQAVRACQDRQPGARTLSGATAVAGRGRSLSPLRWRLGRSCPISATSPRRRTSGTAWSPTIRIIFRSCIRSDASACISRTPRRQRHPGDDLPAGVVADNAAAAGSRKRRQAEAWARAARADRPGPAGFARRPAPGHRRDQRRPAIVRHGRCAPPSTSTAATIASPVPRRHSGRGGRKLKECIPSIARSSRQPPQPLTMARTCRLCAWPSSCSISQRRAGPPGPRARA
jgi:hypothetical protein